ncbi:hypothetical protein MBLNU457_5212t1 [Dothideomycetes sp. NU457]
MTVRQSPRAKVSPEKNNANWPPKSPYEALLSSPSGRKRWQDRQDRSERTPSPSPMRRATLSSNALQAMSAPPDNEDEDEETLQLKLQAIEAKLKLKKLQQARKDKLGQTNQEDRKREASAVEDSPRKRPRLEDSVEIPVSPAKKREETRLPPSPAKVLLGIDKGLRAHDVSLKRPRAGVNAPVGGANGYRARPEESIRKGKSFSERLAESRTSEIEKEAKQDRIERARSGGSGFGITSSAVQERGTAPTRSQSSASRASSQPSTSQTTTSSSSANTTRPSAASRSGATSLQRTQSQTKSGSSKQDPEDDKSEESFDSYSATHLSRRKLSHTEVTRALTDKELYNLPRLLKEVKAPDYDPPDCEANFVVFGILASKSSPYDIKTRHHTTNNEDEDPNSGPKNKFMVLKLTDLNWEIDLFLFDTAFSAYWKLTPGTVLAILNPAIMPPKPGQRDTGRFSLKLTNSDDEILEIGTSRDLGFCASLKKDSSLCNAWINKRKTQHCDYHVNLALDKTRASRMEFNTMFRFGRRTANGSPERKGPKSYRLAPGAFERRKERSNRGRDAETGEHYYLGPEKERGWSTAQMLDSEDHVGKEALRKRKAAEQKEKDLMRKLGEMGNGIGAEYLRSSSAIASKAASEADGGGDGYGLPAPKQSAADLGLVKRSEDVRLSPAKGRKRAFQTSSSAASLTGTTGGGPEAVGWGKAFKWGAFEKNKQDDVLEQGQSKLDGILSAGRKSGSESPKKRARFVLDKGIREPGRESLGDAVGIDSDDELDII